MGADTAVAIGADRGSPLATRSEVGGGDSILLVHGLPDVVEHCGEDGDAALRIGGRHRMGDRIGAGSRRCGGSRPCWRAGRVDHPCDAAHLCGDGGGGRGTGWAWGGRKI